PASAAPPAAARGAIRSRSAAAPPAPPSRPGCATATTASVLPPRRGADDLATLSPRRRRGLDRRLPSPHRHRDPGLAHLGRLRPGKRHRLDRLSHFSRLSPPRRYAPAELEPGRRRPPVGGDHRAAVDVAWQHGAARVDALKIGCSLKGKFSLPLLLP